MNPPPYPPFPLRQRNTMETLDAAAKLFRQYFAVLLGWSALATALILAVTLFSGTLGTIIFAPMLTGAVCCCLAAAVRGQKVEFSQGWKFSQHLYGGMVIANLMAFILFWILIFAVGLIIAFLGVGAATITSGLGNEIQSGLAIVGIAVAAVAGSIFASVLYGWKTLVPIIVCFEEDKRNNLRSLGRSWEILRGQWRRMLVLLTVIGLAYLALAGVGIASLLLISGAGMVRDLVNFRDVTGAAWDSWLRLMLGWATMAAFVQLFWSPFFQLVLGLFYLDVRVRHEALDLEWAAYATSPPPPPEAPVWGAPTSPGALDNAMMPSSFGAPPPAAVAPAPDYNVGTTSLPPSTPIYAAPLESIPPALVENPSPAVPPANLPTITCPQCGLQEPTGSSFCRRCGAALKA